VGRARVALALLLAACTTPRPRLASLETATGAPGSAAILLAPRPPAPYRLDRVVVALDGSILTAEPAPAARVLARFPWLPPGDHTLSVLFVVSRRCSPLGDARETVELSESDTFALDGRAAAVEVRLVGPPNPPAEEGSLRVLFRRRGTAASRFIAGAPPSAEDIACLRLPEPARALCRMHTRMAAARRARDVVRLLCLADKRQALAEIAADLVDLGPSTDAATEHVRARALRQVEALSREARQCRGLDMAYVGSSQATRVARACEGPDPFAL
jgi:hypothetical protein